MKADRTTIAPEKEINSKRAALALFAFIFFARAWLIKVWGSPVPFLDQWDAEALGLFRPWLDGTLRWSDLFAPHNEHRIVLTRLADLALFIVDGNWNPWWQLLLNATLHAATASILLCVFWKDPPPPLSPTLVARLSAALHRPGRLAECLVGLSITGVFLFAALRTRARRPAARTTL